MINAVETKNWNTIKLLLRGLLFEPNGDGEPFKTFMMLNDDKKKEGKRLPEFRR